MSAPLVQPMLGLVSPQLPRREILGMRVDSTTYEGATSTIMAWALIPGSRYVCIANVHMAMEAYDSREFAEVVNGADLVTADGMPLVWALRRLGVKDAQRVCGPELMPYVLRAAAERGMPIGLYGGSSPRFLRQLVNVIREEFPGIEIAFSYSPPFRTLTEEEDRKVDQAISKSGARVLFVGLGCPKQERWMAAHRSGLSCTMLGVGAAFDFLAGIKPIAPTWMKRLGLEWLYRLASEPRRLWKRYLKQNPRFVTLIILQLAKLRRF
jgi:N-acetylglucosaminyldiphosphoundecaprenol N-acetyl-beta-D-mannosaminyltransferase